ncbi:MAG: acetyl-CoA carboxylase biotin carboxyl carrier protein [Verrucomicrobia bacterium]|nr:MAG: acetyl-CoA carboxylase biotin carboxyl carrier protein [Verrucomicrobiota bacterium]
MELKDIKELIALFRKNDLSEFALEQEGFKISLKRGADALPVYSHQPLSFQQAAPQALPAPAAPATAAPAEPSHDIQSPMVGTFYSAASPEAPAFVSVGQQITPESVICIIEAMKVMNEIKAETSGVVVEVLAENGKPVQYGQPLFRLR